MKLTPTRQNSGEFVTCFACGCDRHWLEPGDETNAVRCLHCDMPAKALNKRKTSVEIFKMRTDDTPDGPITPAVLKKRETLMTIKTGGFK